MMCCADTCIVPLQDWLGLDASARMNTPGTVDSNWSWRMTADQITDELSKEICSVTMRYGRANWAALNALAEKEKKAALAAEKRAEPEEKKPENQD